MHAEQHFWKAAMAVVLGLSMALGCGPAQSANSHKLAVSATILARSACTTNAAQSQLAPGRVDRTSAGAVTASFGKTFRCTGPDAVTAGPRSFAQSAPDGYTAVTVEP